MGLLSVTIVCLALIGSRNSGLGDIIGYAVSPVVEGAKTAAGMVVEAGHALGQKALQRKCLVIKYKRLNR